MSRYRLFNPTDNVVVYDLAGHAVDPRSWCESELDSAVMAHVSSGALTIGDQVPEPAPAAAPVDDIAFVPIEPAGRRRKPTANPEPQEDPS